MEFHSRTLSFSWWCRTLAAHDLKQKLYYIFAMDAVKVQHSDVLRNVRISDFALVSGRTLLVMTNGHPKKKKIMNSFPTSTRQCFFFLLNYESSDSRTDGLRLHSFILLCFASLNMTLSFSTFKISVPPKFTRFLGLLNILFFYGSVEQNYEEWSEKW